jgi:RNA polymerase sigma-70 factor, ECF subfamily
MRLRLMNVTLAQMTVSLAASPAQSMPDASFDAETTHLAIQAQAGNAEAFGALVDLHHRAARRVAAAALGGGADVDEAVQDACITAWQRINRLEDPAAFRAWLLRITWRKALDRRRSLTSWLKRLDPRGRRDWRVDAGGGVEDARGRNVANHDFIATIADRGAAPDEQLLDKERDRIVASMIRSLPPRLRDPFLLAATGEHRYEDIAALLKIPVGTVKWRVAEARRVLREKLSRVGL